ncbi:exostosin domain-containing protein [Hymenobacter ginkgonis]|nr:exostosin family protein [Hymenobacter ginkgonis]
MNNSTLSTVAPGAKVYVTSAYPDPEPISAFRAFAAQDRVQKHTVVSSPDEADIILFIENSRYHADYFFSALKNHPLVKKYPAKVFMYNPHDKPWYILPGMYMCMPKNRFAPARMAAGPYVETINPYITCDFSNEPQFLFSFYGATTSSPVRHEVAKLTHPRGNVLISNVAMYVNDRPKDLQLRYANLLTNSKFVLCPKGFGPSSIRLFETLRAGRVPVIISDELVCPAGADWTKFAVFVPESRVSEIPQILEKEELHWQEKAKLARQVWEESFAPDTLFNYFVDSILALDVRKKFGLEVAVRHSLVFMRYGLSKTVVRKVKELAQPLLASAKKN